MSSPLGEPRALTLLPLLLALRMPGALPRPAPSGAVRLPQIRGTIGTTQLMEHFWDRRLLENDSEDEREGEMERMEIQEELPFLIDLNNIPDLVGADFHDHNPNIQVSIEVVENPTMDVEMDLQREGRHDWPLTGSGWPLSGPGAEDGTRILEWWSQWQDDDDNMAGSRKGGSQVANSNWEAIAEHRHVQPAEPAIQESWGPWSACTAACGLGEERRSRSCGPSCTATETQACQGPPCPGITSEDSIQKERFNKDNITYTAPDSCERWLSCNSTFLRSYISSAHSELPSCPCCYPAAVAYGSTQLPDTIGHPIRSQQLGREDGERRDGLWNRNGNSAWDGGNHRRLSQEGGSDLRWDNVGVRDGFRLKEVINTPGTDEPVRLFPWKDASSHKERLDVYHPTARYCIRSLIPPHAKTLAAQKCCYDEDMHLITRGPGAGIPSLVSPEFSPELHQRIDIAPWLACSGDWSRFHTARPPDNRRQCPTNPDSLRFLDLLQQAKDF